MFGHILRGYAMTFSHQKQAISMVGTSGYYYNQYYIVIIEFMNHILYDSYIYIYIYVSRSVSVRNSCVLWRLVIVATSNYN